MMDPVAALGLAGNIVQFVDFSCKVLQDTKNLYESSTGASAENDVIETICNDIVNLNRALTAPSVPGTIPGSILNLTIPDYILNLASNCKGVAAELLQLLGKIKVHGPKRKWKSFIQALRSVWKKEQIEGLVRRMERLRDETQFRLQFMLR